MSGPAVLEVYQNVRILATTWARALCHTMTQSCSMQIIVASLLSRSSVLILPGCSQDFRICVYLVWQVTLQRKDL